MDRRNKFPLRAVSGGFTLIELLIVIVIIGILAGVLIAVINPTAQQSRARDAVVRATINKVALSTSGFVSAYARIPNETEVLSGIVATAVGTTCNTATAADCQFVVTNVDLAVTCATSGWNGTGTTQCNYRYCGGDDTNPGDATFTACTYSATTVNYRLLAKAWGSPNVFMYRSNDSKMYLCNVNGNTCTTL